jgi:hypothetical protein
MGHEWTRIRTGGTPELKMNVTPVDAVAAKIGKKG